MSVSSTSATSYENAFRQEEGSYQDDQSIDEIEAVQLLRQLESQQQQQQEEEEQVDELSPYFENDEDEEEDGEEEIIELTERELYAYLKERYPVNYKRAYRALREGRMSMEDLFSRRS